MRTLFAVALGVATVVLMNCGGGSGGINSAPGSDGGPGVSNDDGSTGPTSVASNLPCDVDTVLADNCRKCHSNPPIAGAPMPLMTWDDLNAPAKSDPTKKVYQLVETRTHDDATPMPPPPNARLDAADQSTIDSWVSAGAPKATSTDQCTTTPTGGDDGGVTTPLTCTPSLHFQAPTPWSMPQSDTNDYVCYGVDVTNPTDEAIVAFAPRVDNTTIVHHMLVFQSDSAYTTTPTVCQAFGNLDWRIIYGWAPGGKNLYLPPVAGFPVAANTTNHYVVQIHYNNINALAGQTDTSGIDLCTSAPRQYDADVVAFGTTNIKIPANSTLSEDCAYTVPAGLVGATLFTAMPHMHTLGTAIDTHLTPAAGGANVDLGTVTNWSFQTQYWLPITSVVAAGDTVTTHCAWKNTTGAEVDFGENTEDEMCFSFTMYYPKITSAEWSWIVPSYSSTCKPAP